MRPWTFGHWTLDDFDQLGTFFGVLGSNVAEQVPATRMAPARENLMFNNLIESCSHRGEFQRRGSFVLFTVASYALFFVIAGVVSIYAYDARMADPNLEVVIMLPPVEFVAPTTAPPNEPSGPPRTTPNQQPVDIRVDLIASVNRPELTPNKVSATASEIPPVRDGFLTLKGRGNVNSDLVRVPQPGSGDSRGTSSNGASVIIDPGTPPPAPEKKPVPTVIRKKVINSEALSLPKPAYPQLAKQLRIQGPVSIQVLVDETGKVVSAKPVSGDPFLVRGAQSAAYQARFSPTLIGDQPVKVSGVITYNFVLQP
jgi:protein TonB